MLVRASYSLNIWNLDHLITNVKHKVVVSVTFLSEGAQKSNL